MKFTYKSERSGHGRIGNRVNVHLRLVVNALQPAHALQLAAAQELNVSFLVKIQIRIKV